MTTTSLCGSQLSIKEMNIMDSFDIIGGYINTINNPALGQADYRKYKPKVRQASDDNMYYNMGYNVLLSIFEYDEKIYRPELFDSILHDTGSVALIKTKVADYTPALFADVGDLMPDGMLKDCICFDLSGKEYDFNNWRENPDVLVFFNNFTYTTDNFLSKYAYLLTNVDASIDANVLYSRLQPVPVVTDAKTKNQVDTIINDLMNGKVSTVIADSKIRELLGTDRPPIEVFNLTSVENSKYIQYLQHLHDSLISRLFFHMGLSISDNGKQAQISIEELNKNKSASLSILYGWYEMRKRGFDKAKEKTGVDFSFKFSEIWKSEWEYQTEQPEEQMQEESGSQLPDEEGESDGNSDV